MELSNRIEQQAAAASIVGALAQEVNNPLQGILSLVSVLRRECEDADPARRHLEQIRDGLDRIRRTIESFAIVYENLPRPCDQVRVERFLGWLSAALAERQFHVELRNQTAPDTHIFCMAPEVVRLLCDTIALQPDLVRELKVIAEPDAGDCVLLRCERGTGISSAPWENVAALGGFSGMAILIHELIKLSGGESEFRLDQASLSGIRLRLRTRME